MKIIQSIRFCIFFVMSATLILFCTAYILFQKENKKQHNTVRVIQQQEIKRSFESMLHLKQESYNSILIDYACYDWMLEFIKNPSNYQAIEYITPSTDLKINIFQAYTTNTKLAYTDNNGYIENQALPIPAHIFLLLDSLKYLHFFIHTEKGYCELFASTMHPSSDLERKTEAQGYLIIGKLWDNSYIQTLSNIINAKLSFNNKTDNSLYNLQNEFGKTVISIAFEQENLYEQSIKKYAKNLNLLFALLGLAIILLCNLAYSRLVIKPLSIIEKSLNSKDASILPPLIQKENEYSIIANMIVQYFLQIDDINQKVKEIEQHKKDLHELNEELQTQTKHLESAYTEITQQKTLTDEQNKILHDSIMYASMIQNAVIIPQFSIDTIFKERCIIYMPKDVISGDIVWFKEFHGNYYFACADCTGHGLSGAMTSMLGISFLNELTHHNINKDISPAVILNKLRTKLVTTLHQTGEIGEIRDSIDIGLCKFNPKTKKLQFAGAFHSLFVFRKTKEETYEHIEYKGDRMPVGIYDIHEKFTLHSINVKSDDRIYLLTDGYTDQFGGPQGKKVTKKTVLQLLESIQQYPMKQQKQELLKFINEWMTETEQIDDITIIGLKIP